MDHICGISRTKKTRGLKKGYGIESRDESKKRKKGGTVLWEESGILGLGILGKTLGKVFTRFGLRMV